MFIIIEENGREEAGIYFSSKKPVSHHGGEKRAVNSLQCYDVPELWDRSRKEQIHVLLHCCGC
ncbi:hypothetical protein [Bacillus atrophaeus]|uniref:hypothetical protein n=1 Tax=Bacillus atrophaeus TaxID=1452 RepID=UPI001670D311|nr:hypothetical protein [Bacillus atrophaeus]